MTLVNAIIPLVEPIQEAPAKTPTLKDMVSVLLNPQVHEQEQVADYTGQLKSLLGNHKLGRMNILMILAGSMEPCEARDTELGRVFPKLIPLRSIKEAWQIITEDPGLLDKFERRCGRLVDRLERRSVMTMRMFEAALFWDPSKERFPAYLLASRPIRKVIAHSRDQGSGIDADGLFYSESRQTTSGERATGISVRRISDPNIVDRLMAGSEAIDGNSELRKWFNERLATLDERAEKVLRMRFGITIPEGVELPRKADWSKCPTTAARVQLEELRILKGFAKRGLPTDARNQAAINAAARSANIVAAARARRLASG